MLYRTAGKKLKDWRSI